MEKKTDSFPEFTKNLAAIVRPKIGEGKPFTERFMAVMVTYVSQIAQKDTVSEVVHHVAQHEKSLNHGNHLTSEYLTARNDKRMMKHELSVSKKQLAKLDIKDEIDRFLRDSCGVPALQRPQLVASIQKELKSYAHTNKDAIVAEHIKPNFAQLFIKSTDSMSL